MFDIGWSELVVIGVVALIAIGPKELPGVRRSLGHWMGKVRRMAGEFQDQFREAMREAEVSDLKRQFDEASAKATAGFTNPLETAQKEVEKAFGTEPSSTDASSPSPSIAATDPGAIEPSASASVTETPSPETAQEPAHEPAAADAPMDIKPAETTASDSKPGGGGAA